MSKDTLALISINAPEHIEALLKNDGFEVLRMPPSERLAVPVRTHTDMLVFVLENTVFCHESYMLENGETFDTLRRFGYNAVSLGGEYSSDYPKDVRLNIARVGNKLIVGKRTQAEEICEYAKKYGFDILYTSQGYVKCSSCIVGDNALVTADANIAKTASEKKIDVLRICEGGVRLDGYSYGFIGGASGCFGDTVYFVGDIRRHADGEAIISFCKKYGKRVKYTENEELTDIGSILFLPSLNF